DGARVAHCEPLARGASAVELAAGGAVEDGVADEVRVAGRRRRRGDRDPAAAHRLADAVVRLALEVELDAGREERAEALPGDAREARADAAGRRRGSEAAPDQPAEARADGAVAVAHAVRRLDERRAFERGRRVGC